MYLGVTSQDDLRKWVCYGMFMDYEESFWPLFNNTFEKKRGEGTSITAYLCLNASRLSIGDHE